MSRPERRLAAIVAADMVGYSRLMEADEAGTVARLRELRQQVIDPCVSRHAGRLIKSTGDGLLLEFHSVVDALGCAIEVQRALATANEEQGAAPPFEFRIGINLGDVIVQDDDLFGDGVNIAARLQEMAEAGGVFISQAVREQVGDRLEVAFEDLGERQAKNIQRPIRVFRVAMGQEARTQARVKPAAQSSSDRPTIAVLPFTNMSGEPEQEFFADGLTEDILTALSRFKELFVISRNSAFRYKGQAVSVQEVARDLGVQFIVEGSVRKAGNRVRVTVQLIDAETDRHVWAERYDRELEDIFALQDEMTSAMVGVLPGRVAAARHDRAKRKPTENMAAYELVLAGKSLHHRSNREDNAEALRLLDRAVALDPKYAHAYAWRGCVLGQAWTYNWCADRSEQERLIGEALGTAHALDDNDSDVHRILAAIAIVQHEFDMARYHQERALSLNPNDDLIVVQQGELLTWLGEAEQGIDWIEKAMRLNPFHPERFWSHLGRAHFVARRYAQARDAFKRLTAPETPHLAFLAACAAELGETEAAAAYAGEITRRDPGFSVAGYLATQHYQRDADREHHRAALLKAGLPA